MNEVRAQIEVLESCARALSDAGNVVGSAADGVAAADPGGNSAGTTAASAELITALAGAAEHWQAELVEGARLLGALGLAVDQNAVALRNLDDHNADAFRAPASTAG